MINGKKIYACDSFEGLTEKFESADVGASFLLISDTINYPQSESRWNII